MIIFNLIFLILNFISAIKICKKRHYKEAKLELEKRLPTYLEWFKNKIQ